MAQVVLGPRLLNCIVACGSYSRCCSACLRVVWDYLFGILHLAIFATTPLIFEDTFGFFIERKQKHKIQKPKFPKHPSIMDIYGKAKQKKKTS